MRSADIQSVRDETLEFRDRQQAVVKQSIDRILAASHSGQYLPERSAVMLTPGQPRSHREPEPAETSSARLKPLQSLARRPRRSRSTLGLKPDHLRIAVCYSLSKR